jgi:hypothetical protein
VLTISLERAKIDLLHSTASSYARELHAIPLKARYGARVAVGTYDQQIGTRVGDSSGSQIDRDFGDAVLHDDPSLDAMPLEMRRNGRSGSLAVCAVPCVRVDHQNHNLATAPLQDWYRIVDGPGGFFSAVPGDDRFSLICRQAI